MEEFEPLCSECIISNIPNAVHLDNMGSSLSVTNQDIHWKLSWESETDEMRASDCRRINTSTTLYSIFLRYYMYGDSADNVQEITTDSLKVKSPPSTCAGTRQVCTPTEGPELR